MKCPIDGSELSKNLYEDSVEIEKCNTCHGAWLDKGELEKIEEIKINDYTDELKKIPDYVGNAYAFAKSKNKDSLNCPKCNAELERREYGYCSLIFIDSCIQGHGIWLDRNELEALEIFYERSRHEAKDIKKGFLVGLLDLFRN